MLRKCLVLAALLLLPLPAVAQGIPNSSTVVTACGTPPSTYTPGQIRSNLQDTNGNQCGPGSSGSPTITTPIPVTPIPSSAAAACQVIKAAPGNLGGFNIVNLTATGGFVEVINATSAPADGALTGGTGSGNLEDWAILPASGETSASFTPALHIYSVGVTICVTSASTPYTKTTGVITAAITGSTQ